RDAAKALGATEQLASVRRRPPSARRVEDPPAVALYQIRYNTRMPRPPRQVYDFGAGVGTGLGVRLAGEIRRKTNRDDFDFPCEIEVLSRSHNFRSAESLHRLLCFASADGLPSGPAVTSMRRAVLSSDHSAVTVPLPAGPIAFS